VGAPPAARAVCLCICVCFFLVAASCLHPTSFAQTEVTQPANRLAVVALHNGASISPDQVLHFDSAGNQFATLASPSGLKPELGIRLESRFRLTRQQAGQHILGRQGTASIYVDSQNRIRALLWTDEGKPSLITEKPISLNEWHTVVLDYRPDGYLKVFIDGQEAGIALACGTLKSPPGDFVAGRWEWEENGKPRSAYASGDFSTICLGPSQEKPRSPSDRAPRLAQHFSWGDMILFGQADTKAKIRETLEKAKARSVQVAHWRVDDYVLKTYHQFIPEEQQAEYIRKYRRIIDAVYKEFDPTLEAVRVGHELGLKVYGWQCIFDEGAPPTVKYADTSPFPWQSKFTIAHPEFCVADRNGARQWGVMEYAYPEVRSYKVAQIIAVTKRFGLDGVFISTRSHSEPALQADRFGFNDPIVQEFKRRYGKDIRTEDFDREKWRRLRGEYLTQFLRELRAALPKDKRLCIGVPRGDYFGPPFGNMFIDWRTWVAERLVDEVVVGEITGVRGLYPKRKSYEGYLFDQEAGTGLAPVEEDVRDKYGPACKTAGVELYVHSSPLAPWVWPLLDRGLTGLRF